MGKLVLLSNFRDGYPEMIKKVADKESVIFSYIPSRTEFGEIYYNRVINAYQEMGIRKFQYVDIDKKYKKEPQRSKPQYRIIPVTVHNSSAI